MHSRLCRWLRAVDVLWRRHEPELVYRFTLCTYVGIVWLMLMLWGAS